MNALSGVTNGRATSPPGTTVDTIPRAMRRLTLKKTTSAPSLHNLPPLNGAVDASTGIRYVSRDGKSSKKRFNSGKTSSSPESDTHISPGPPSPSSQDSPTQSPRFVRHISKVSKHASMPDMRLCLTEQQAIARKRGLTHTRNIDSPTSIENSPDLLRRVLRRTTSFGSDECSGNPNLLTPDSSPATRRRHIYSTESSPLIRRRSGPKACDTRTTNGTSLGSPSCSPAMSPRFSFSRMSSRPDTPVPAPRTSIRSSSHNDISALAVDRLRVALDEGIDDDRLLMEDPEQFVESYRRKPSDKTDEENAKNKAPLNSDTCHRGDLTKECVIDEGYINDVDDGLNEQLELRTVDQEETITFLCEETIDETPEYQKEPEPKDSRIHQWLAAVENERWEAKNVMLPHIISSSNT